MKLHQFNLGDKVKAFGDKRVYTVRALSDRYIIISKPVFGKPLYSILDFKERIAGSHNMIFGDFDYMKQEDCERALKLLMDGESPFEISHRNRVTLEQVKLSLHEKAKT